MLRYPADEPKAGVGRGAIDTLLWRCFPFFLWHYGLFRTLFLLRYRADEPKAGLGKGIVVFLLWHFSPFFLWHRGACASLSIHCWVSSGVFSSYVAMQCGRLRAEPLCSQRGRLLAEPLRTQCGRSWTEPLPFDSVGRIGIFPRILVYLVMHTNSILTQSKGLRTPTFGTL